MGVGVGNCYFIDGFKSPLATNWWFRGLVEVVEEEREPREHEGPTRQIGNSEPYATSLIAARCEVCFLTPDT